MKAPRINLQVFLSASRHRTRQQLSRNRKEIHYQNPLDLGKRCTRNGRAHGKITYHYQAKEDHRLRLGTWINPCSAQCV
ncbi:hypothetical protein AALO_G00126680 [Alosa alosa]|uniref:Uncharacterized protein n=1 Tax=Alosa alosa TaxID=278164 RepID=A0AAV6GQA2_9TELE|nr:hypothetical protein AALO_G00126680 [Alosa alosa]